MTKTQQVVSLILSRRPWNQIKTIAGVNEADLIELFRSESRGPIARAFHSNGVDRFFMDLLDEAHPRAAVANGITLVDDKWQVGFRLDGEIIDLGQWSDVLTAKRIFGACRWLVTGQGIEPRPTHRTFVEGKLRETSFSLRSSAA